MSRLHKPEINFTQVSNQILTNAEVSLKAKGLYVYLVSKPDNYDFSAKRIADECKENYTTILGILNELEERKYLLRKKYGDGTIDYYLFNEPKENPKFAILDEEPKLENPTQDPKLQSPTLQPINKTDTSTKEINNEAENFVEDLIKDFMPSEMAQRTVERICPDMTEQDFETEFVKFKLYFQENWPHSPETKWINWCQSANSSYKQLKEKQLLNEKAGELANERVQKFHEKKLENIANAKTTSNFKSREKVELDLGRNYPIDDFKGRTAKKQARVYKQDFSSEEQFKSYLNELEDLGVEIVAMDFEYLKTKKALPLAKPTFGQVPSLDADKRMAEVEAAKNREVLKKQLENA